MTTTENHQQTTTTGAPVVIVGGAGKTGRRVADRLEAAGLPHRYASRSTTPSFDWDDRDTWRGALEGARAAYIAFQPDLAVPGSDEAIAHLVTLARDLGVARVVLLSGRGEEGAEAAERVAFASHDDVTVCRASWFAENFTEGAMADAIRAGALALPVPADVPEPFIALDDLADVVVAALTDEDRSRHAGVVHEVTGSQSLSFADVARAIGAASGREVDFARVSPDSFVRTLVADGVDASSATFLAELFGELFDGRNVTASDGVRTVLGRDALSFTDWARNAAQSGAWGGTS